MTRALTFFILLLLLPLGPHAATWRVEYNPNDPEGLIGAVAQAASSGDTIVVGPGIYYEHIPLEGKSLTLKSLQGPDDTVIDGSRDFNDRENGIIYMVGGGPANLRVEGFTFRNGGGAPDAAGIQTGGAIGWWTRGHEGSVVEILDCRFTSNSTGSDKGGRGGAIYLSDVSSTLIASCSFEGNESRDAGGSIYISEGGFGHHRVSDCQFILHSAPLSGGGAAIFSDGPNTITIENNSFISHEDAQTASLEIWSLNSRVTGNIFEDHGGTLATRLRFKEGGVFGSNDYALEFTNNIVWNDFDPPGEGEWRIDMFWSRSSVDLAGNTLVNTSLLWQSSQGFISCRRNIFYETPVHFHTEDGGDILCNDAWPEGISTSQFGDYVFDSNISEDPLFCDPGFGDFHIAEGSLWTDRFSRRDVRHGNIRRKGYVGADKGEVQVVRESGGQAKLLTRMAGYVQGARTRSHPHLVFRAPREGRSRFVGSQACFFAVFAPSFHPPSACAVFLFPAW
jgi:hypothetical protein